MAKKRRTRKDKEKARHNITLTWEPSKENPPRHELVKGQINLASNELSKGKRSPKKANISAKDDSYARIKHDIVRSLLLASLILSLVVVLYLIRG